MSFAVQRALGILCEYPHGMSAGELDEFQLVRPLGKGGMGEVYLGHDTVLDRAVAIKLIGSRNPDAGSRERFLIEARAIARLSHPNVVTIFRVGTTGDGRPFLVQELIRGRSLDQVARPLPWRQVCELAIGIARGLEAAHRRGILHRDVKPGNVMLDENGTARLLDFGLAKLSAVAEPPLEPTNPRAVRTPEAGQSTLPSPTRFAKGSDPVRPVTESDVEQTRELGVAETRAAPADAADVAVTRDAPEAQAPPSPPPPSPSPGEVLRTQPGSVIGTPRYTAPELWSGGAASAQSDLYSLGVMLYELLASVAPFPQTNIVDLEAAVVAGVVRPVGELAPETHPALARIVMRCLTTDARQRPSSAAELLHELEAVLVEAPAVPEGNPYRGLRAFDAEHRGLFFGRGTDVSVLVDRLRTEPLLVVVGDSGIGKSSVCHAGVVPAVQTGALGDRRQWRVVPIVPGRAPWTAMRDALEIDAARAGYPAAELVRELRPAAGDGILIVIDQLEELVTLSEAGEAARVAEVLAAIANGVPGVKALLAVRGDFLTRVAALPELGGPMTRGLHLLRVLSEGDLREAVVGPARAKGVSYETDAMVGTLVDAVAGNPGTLPLLQFTLAELWQARDVERGVIPASALDKLGGVEGGLASHADGVLLALGPEERAAARRIVLRLISSSHTRAVRDRDELVGDDRVAATALESLVSGRLVVARDTVEGTPSYELAHEALIRSWGTLRDWLDAAAGQHVVRNRLIASAAEWQRLDRRGDLLWTRRQLDEARDVADLNPKERAFVDASRRQLRRRRFARVAAIAAVPMIALAIFGVVRYDAARRRDREVAARVEASTAAKTEADRLTSEAARARREAYAKFDADEDGEPRWADARRFAADARAKYREATVELEAAFLVDSGSVREQMAAVLVAHAELAEAERDDVGVAELLLRLQAYDSEGVSRWHQPARLVVELDRPGRITVHAFRPDAETTIAGGFDARPIFERDGARLDELLRPGSYVSVIAMPDGHVVRDPVLLARGERLVRAIAVPPRSAAPAGFVFIPAGRSLYGSAREDAFRREWLTAQPQHEVHDDAFWIARTEVTFDQWIQYLRALSPDERQRRRPSLETTQNTVSLDEKNGRFSLSIRPATTMYQADEGSPLVYPGWNWFGLRSPGRNERREVRWERLPVVGISYLDALAYAAWLGDTGRVPGARVCTLREWERAARGADGRSFPHGEVLRPSDANFDETYDRTSLGYGPDEVGSFPVSDSPFGVADMVGNVWEVTEGSNTKPWLKGGSFYQGQVSALSSNNNASEPTQRGSRYGLRVCAGSARAR